MKTSVKLLSLLTAGLLSLSLLTACKDEMQTVPASTTATDVSYEGLTPEQIYQSLQQTDDFVFITMMDRQVEGANIVITYMLEKDNDVLRYTIYQDAEDDLYDVSSTIYIDLKNNICIAPSDKEMTEWYVLGVEAEQYSLTKLIENCTPTELLFDNDHYRISGGVYQLTEKALLEMIGSSTATVSGRMTEKNSTYVFEVVTEEAGNKVTMTTKVLFQKVSVAMPTYNTGSTTTAQTTTSLPEATTAPEAAPTPELDEQ